jgi:hypothetical protein
MTDDDVLELARLYRAVEAKLKRDQRGELFADLQTAKRKEPTNDTSTSAAAAKTP